MNESRKSNGFYYYYSAAQNAIWVEWWAEGDHSTVELRSLKLRWSWCTNLDKMWKMYVSCLRRGSLYLGETSTWVQRLRNGSSLRKSKRVRLPADCMHVAHCTLRSMMSEALRHQVKSEPPRFITELAWHASRLWCDFCVLCPRSFSYHVRLLIIIAIIDSNTWRSPSSRCLLIRKVHGFL